MKRVLATALILACALAACTKQEGPSASLGAASGTIPNGDSPPSINTSTTDQNSWTVPHVLRITIAAEGVETLNPLLTPDTSVSLIIGPLTMGYLVRTDRQNNLVPELITVLPTKENGGVSKDGLTITYHLRKGVRWSDGAPFTADDVIFSFQQVLNPNNNVTSRQGFDDITKMDEPDKYTVVLHLKKPYSPFLETFFSTAGAEPALLPKHLLAGYPNLNHVAYNSKPVGIGPFMVKVWQRGERVVMVRNPYYFRGEPKLQEIDYEIIPDANTALTEMQARSLDLSYQAPPTEAEQIEKMTAFIGWAQPSFYFRHFDFNVTSPKLKDVAVRRALRYAMNRPAIIASIYHGLGILQDQPAPRVSSYWDPSIKPVPFDIAKANAILDAAGWKRGANGIRSKDGVTLNLEVATASGTVVNDDLLEEVREMWKQIGVAMTISHYQNTLLFGQYQDNGILARGKFDVAYFAWGDDAIGDFSGEYMCSLAPPAGQNYMHWCDPAANRAMTSLYSDYTQAERNKDDAILYKQLNDQVPTIVLMGTEALWIYNKDLKNFDPSAVSPFDNFMNVDI